MKEVWSRKDFEAVLQGEYCSNEMRCYCRSQNGHCQKTEHKTDKRTRNDYYKCKSYLIKDKEKRR